MPRETPRQADSWAQVKVGLNALDREFAKLPPPPTPRDSWAEKVNALHRILEGMREQLDSELEQEDLRVEREEDES